MKELLNKISREQLYGMTGIQFMQFNSIFQLYALKTYNPEFLERAEKLLFMPDLFNYFLTGHSKTEFTIATTSQLYNPVKRAWEEKIFELLDVPISLMQDVLAPGTALGMLTQKVQKEIGVPEMPVVATASHDTGAAVAAVPGKGGDWVFISSGTWSIMGKETDEPIITERAYQL